MNPSSDQPKTPDSKPGATADPKPDASVAKPEVKDDTKADTKPTAAASKPDAKADAKPDAKSDHYCPGIERAECGKSKYLRGGDDGEGV